MQVGILTAIHGRAELSAAMIRYARLQALRLGYRGHPTRLYAVLTPEDAPAIGHVLDLWGADWCPVENNPVSLKWQAGVNMVRAGYQDLEALVILNSDGFASLDYLTYAIDQVGQGSAGGGPDRIVMVNAETGEAGLWRGPWYAPGSVEVPAGSGRIFSRALLDSVDWRLWPEPRDNGLDTLCSMHLANNRQRLDLFDMTDRGAVLDIKTAENLHPWPEMVPQFTETWGPREAAAYVQSLGFEIERMPVQWNRAA